jgi:hypothetical protein
MSQKLSEKQYHFVVIATVRDGVVDKCHFELDPHMDDYFLEGTVYDVHSEEWEDSYSDENIEIDEQVGMTLLNIINKHNESRHK